MSTMRTTLLTRRYRIIVPFLFVYGLGLYLVAGAIGDAFSGQSPHPQADLVIERSGKAPGQPRASASATAKAVRAVENNAAVRNLARGQRVSIRKAGPWTASEDPAEAGPAPQGEVGVALRVDLPEPVDLDLKALPGPGGSSDNRTPGESAADADIVRGVTSLVVLYDPATGQIVSILPVPESAPALPTVAGTPPDVGRQGNGGGGTR